jgi:hypothetical protein
LEGIFVNIRGLVMLTAGVSGCLSMPAAAAGLAAPVVTQTLYNVVTAQPDSGMRATPAGQQASYSSPGTQTLFMPTSGEIGGEAQAGGTISFAPSPSIVVSSHAAGFGVVPDSIQLSRDLSWGLGRNEAGSSGSIAYQLQVTGPSGFVGLAVNGTIGLSMAGLNGRGSANASLLISDSSGNDIVGDFIFGSTAPAPGQGPVTLNRLGDFNANYAGSAYHEAGTYLIQTNQVYTVRLVAGVGAIIDASRTQSDSSFTAQAFSDPTFSIDAGANADAYQLSFSEGIGNAAPVPEPSSVSLTLAGFGMLYAMFRLGSQRGFPRRSGRDAI